MIEQKTRTFGFNLEKTGEFFQVATKLATKLGSFNTNLQLSAKCT